MNTDIFAIFTVSPLSCEAQYNEKPALHWYVVWKSKELQSSSLSNFTTVNQCCNY